jgi:hypothetical protein
LTEFFDSPPPSRSCGDAADTFPLLWTPIKNQVWWPSGAIQPTSTRVCSDVGSRRKRWRDASLRFVAMDRCLTAGPRRSSRNCDNREQARQNPLQRMTWPNARGRFPWSPAKPWAIVIAWWRPSSSGRNSQAPSSTAPSTGTLTSSFKAISRLLANKHLSPAKSPRVSMLAEALAVGIRPDATTQSGFLTRAPQLPYDRSYCTYDRSSRISQEGLTWNLAEAPDGGQSPRPILGAISSRQDFR